MRSLKTSMLAVTTAVISMAIAAHAQEECGTVVLPQDIDVVRALTDAGVYDPPQESGSPIVTLTFHVVRRSDGTGGINPTQLVTALDDANLYFSNAGIYFCWPGPTDYIDDDAFYYDIDTQAEIDALRQINVVPNTINIYFTPNLPYCGISSFTWSDVQGIVMNNSCTGVSTNHSTFPHEIGHYFDLLHTHETAWGAECVICCNCNTEGDFLCDTPADPNLSGVVDTDCGYTGTALDPCDNVPYQPDTHNLMSYSRKECRNQFTNQQNWRMQATLQRLRPELMGGSCPGENQWNIDAKLLPADGAASDWFGGSVSVSGDTAVIGAKYDDDNGSKSGSAYVFTRSGGIWTQQAKLLPADGAASDNFGSSVSVSGDTAVIGASYDNDNGSDSGSAYVFTRSGGVWTQQAKLLPADGATDDHFGWSVSVSGDTVVIGAYGDDDNGDYSGSAYVFTRSGGVWTQQAKLLPADGAADDYFGESVSVSGDTAVIGAYGDDNGDYSGSAYVFTRTGGVWTQQAKLLPADGAADDYFGCSVSVSGDTAAIGAWWDDDNGTDSGSAYVFTRTGGDWTQQAKLLPGDGAVEDYFGASVSVSGDTAVIGASYDNDNGSDSGSAYVFTRSGGVWTQQAKLLPADGATDDHFGWSVSVSGDTVVIGARGDDDNGSDSGSAYVWTDINALRLCPADFNEDGTVNSQDFIAFLNAFVLGDPSADFNGDGTVNSQDFIAFLNAFVAGC